MYSSILFGAIFLSQIPAFEAFCHGARSRYRAQFMGRLVQDNQVLTGHVISNFTVHNFTECSGHCNDDCRCMSFNLPMSGKGLCELNDADNTTAMMKPLRGTRYHHLEKIEVLHGDDTCWQPYENGCCASNPCENGATCTDTHEHGKPSFACDCSTTIGYFGQRCHRRITNCLDYLWMDKTSPDGAYNIWDENHVMYPVTCKMLPEKLEAWTNVMAFPYQNNILFQDAAFFENVVYNELDATVMPFRLPLAKMNSVVTAIEAMGVAPEWKATCYDLDTDTESTTDVVKSSFKTLDILQFKNDYELVGFYPFNKVIAGQDQSGFDNHGTFSSVTYAEGPLGNKDGSIRMYLSTVTLSNPSTKLDLSKSRGSLTIMMQIKPSQKHTGELISWGSSAGWGLLLRLHEEFVQFFTWDRATGSEYHAQANGFGVGLWSHVAVVYNFDDSSKAIYLNGTLLKKKNVVRQTVRTQLSPIRVATGPGGHFLGDMACLRLFQGVLPEQEIATLAQDWSCVKKPDYSCKRVDYISYGDKECHGCSVAASQSPQEAFNIDPHRSGKLCSFKPDSTVANEKLFGFYDKVSTTHACVSSPLKQTRYWFGGKL